MELLNDDGSTSITYDALDVGDSSNYILLGSRRRRRWYNRVTYFYQMFSNGHMV